jgi:selenocysteine-specific elongation factor
MPTAPPPPALVLGTAGHIDHGKTRLVFALTGVDLDRLPEERARGITIALGFTALLLPDGRVASVVDVPGHERLVRTMVSGATGLDAVLLCVSAVEGVMPQTREHLAILDLLGVRRGVVALTMCDLVDAEMLELARLDVEDAVQGTFLEGAPILPTAAGPAPAGLDALKAALAALPSPGRAAGGPLRLPVDRAFVQRGFGTVVTGTLRGGIVHDGDEVEILPIGQRARVRGLQVHGAPAAASEPGRRTALNLAGVERDDLGRGQVISHPGAIEPARVLDVELRLLPDAPALEAGARARLLIGTAEVMTTVHPLGPIEEDPDGIDPDPLELGPGAAAWVQLRTDAPVVALPGDRFILRRESPVQTLGGGQVWDPWAPRARARGRERAVAELRALRAGDDGVRLLRAGDAGLRAAEARGRGITGGVALADQLLHPTRAAALEDRLLTGLQAWHAAHPLAPGAPRRELHGTALQALPERAFDALVARLAAAGRVELEGPRLRLPGFAVRLDGPTRAALDALEAELRAAGLELLRFQDLADRQPELVGLLMHGQRLVRLGDRAAHADALEAMKAAVVAHLQAQPRLTPADFKDLFGLTRRSAIPLLEWLDQQRITQREGDARILRAPAG